MYYYCTYFDKNYLYKGLALYRSLERHSPPFLLYILAFDDITFEILNDMSLPYVRLIRQDDFERGDVALQMAKSNRSRVEYYWTCTPSLPLYLFANSPEVDLLTYLDSDIYFFSDPTPIFLEFGNDSILITEHRYPKRLRYLESNGIYNVQMMSFRRDTNGIDCLRWWRDRCLEWCYNRLENGKLGDQKYLDDWTKRFHKVHVLRHIGGGVAPWNFSQYDIESRDGDIYVDGYKLIFYHFHQFRILTGGRFYFASSLYTKEKELPNAIYQPYIREIIGSIAQVRQINPQFDYGISSHIPVILHAGASKYLPVWAKNAIKKAITLW